MLDKIQLNEKEKKIRIIERKIDELKAQGKLYAEQYKQALSGLEEYGIKDPKDIKPTIISIKKEMEELEAEINKILPDDILDKMIALDVDEVINNKVNDQIDLDQDFGDL